MVDFFDDEKCFVGGVFIDKKKIYAINRDFFPFLCTLL